MGCLFGGIFTILPEQKTVHYQRRHSVFAQQAGQRLSPFYKKWDSQMLKDCHCARKSEHCLTASLEDVKNIRTLKPESPEPTTPRPGSGVEPR